MRVAILSHNARAADAIGNHIAEKVSFFLDRGADLRVFIEDARHLHDRLREHYELVDEPRTSGPAWRFLESADLIAVEYGHHYPLFDFLPLLAGGRPRILFDYHGVTPPRFWSGSSREAAEMGIACSGLAWCAETVIAHSRFSAQELARNAGLPADRMRLMPLAIDRNLFCPGAPRDDLRGRLGIGPSRLILFVGRIAPNKCIPLVIKSLALVKAVEPPLHVAIVGDASDIYRAEADRCLRLADQLGVAKRVHVLGQLSTDRLIEAYRSADVFVMPSVHEGFCIPVVEANACGVPVIAARAAALTETVGDAGLTFTPNDPEDLARHLSNVLEMKLNPSKPSSASHDGRLRVAVISLRYGPEVVGGAESSLRLIAETLKSKGHEIEVFTTCTRSESTWANDLPEGTIEVGKVTVHRFPVDPHDRDRHLATVQSILESGGTTCTDLERAYLDNSLHSRRLVEALSQRLNEFDAVMVGPYLFGLTHDVATAFGERVLLVPCFHDEPLARLSVWPNTFIQVGGILYHSAEEQDLAQRKLGLNHPRAHLVGTWIDTTSRGADRRGRQLVGGSRPYLVYCGRYSPEKNLPRLFDYGGNYERLHPGRFTIAFAGAGDLIIPNEPWAVDLGVVSNVSKQDLMSGAAALVQLSDYESLSLAALEAWAQETPVLASRDCTVLRAHVDASRGGTAIGSFEEFAACLDSLWDRPAEWQDMGKRGRAYVENHFGSKESFCEKIVGAINDLQRPLRQCLIERGLERAKRYGRAIWREQFGTLVDNLIHAPKRTHEEFLEIVPRDPVFRITTGARLGLVPVRIRNRGTLPALAKGPARWQLRAQVMMRGEPGQAEITPLPCILVPNQEVPAAIRVMVPAEKGDYDLKLTAVRADGFGQISSANPGATCSLVVAEESGPSVGGCCTSLLRSVQDILAEASSRSDLPDDYLDVTEGWLAALKRLIKRKLLGNFKHAYVDVISRQQSALNRRLISAAAELADCCAILDHARELRDRVERGSTVEELTQQMKTLVEELNEFRRSQEALESRIVQIERRLTSSSVDSTID